MAFDPSVIGGIGDSVAVDPAANQGKALTLADLYDQRTIRKGQMAATAQEQEDMTYARQILSGKDLTKLEDQDSAVAAITKRNPKLGMELMRSFGEGRQQKQEYDRGQLELVAAKNDIMGSYALQLKNQHDEFLRANPNATPQQVHDAMQAPLFQTLQQMRDARLPDGKPLLNEQDMQTLGKGFSQGYNQQFVDNAVAQSTKAAAALKVHLEERKQETSESKEKETERHNRATEELGDRRLAGAQFSEPDEELLGAMADHSVNLPAGLRSQAQIRATLKGLRDRHPDLNSDQIAEGLASGKIKLTAETAAGRTAGTQIGKVALAANELDTFGDQVLDASKALPRDTPVGLTLRGLIQMGEKQASNSGLLNLKLKLTALNNAYDQLSARGGTDTEKRAHIHELFDARLTDEAIQTLVTGVKQEAKGARDAANRTIGEVSNTAIPGAGAETAPGITKSPAPGAAGAGQAPPPGGAGAPGAGTPPPPPGFVIQQ